MANGTLHYRPVPPSNAAISDHPRVARLPQTNERKESMMFSLRDALAVGSIHLSTEFFSLTQGMIQIRQQIEDELVRQHHTVPLRTPNLTTVLAYAEELLRHCRGVCPRPVLRIATAFANTTTVCRSRQKLRLENVRRRLPIATSQFTCTTNSHIHPVFTPVCRKEDMCVLRLEPSLDFTLLTTARFFSPTDTGKTGGRNDDVSATPCPTAST